jgi:hypothetical protein
VKPVKDLAKSHAVQTGVAAAAAAAAGAVAGARRARRASSAELEVPDLAPVVQGYCVKERKKVMIENAVQTTMKNGKPAITGVCPDCGTKVFRIGALPAA